MEKLLNKMIQQNDRLYGLIVDIQGNLFAKVKSAVMKQEKQEGKVIVVKCWSEIDLEEGEYLMTIGDALRVMNVVRATLYNIRIDGLLRTYRKGRSVRFRSREIDKAVVWYSIPKGKL